jgi:hypothetical protein
MPTVMSKKKKTAWFLGCGVLNARKGAFPEKYTFSEKPLLDFFVTTGRKIRAISLSRRSLIWNDWSIFEFRKSMLFQNFQK